ncbi:NEQ264 [Nanoarchaeum equitans Kin4-M]|uniref:Protein translation factor SUI1 homolog n=1 Tax=Nanoarchaeum equitans (strain Kin4-M) TaxID=228908 RepID=Q74MS6_NANEQ|nr:NEQ264 [Nanoarchaeum equitans Kin4-M]
MKLKKISGGFDELLEELESQIEQETRKIKVVLDERKKKKRTPSKVTIIYGIPEEEAEEVVKYLKKKIGTGGTYKNGAIELRGDVRKKIKPILIELGYREDQIEIE